MSAAVASTSTTSEARSSATIERMLRRLRLRRRCRAWRAASSCSSPRSRRVRCLRSGATAAIVLEPAGTETPHLRLSRPRAGNPCRPVIKTLILALGGLAIVFWIGLAYWVNKDARRRSRNLFLIGVATLLGLVPYVGPLGLPPRPPGGDAERYPVARGGAGRDRRRWQATPSPRAPNAPRRSKRLPRLPGLHDPAA